MSCTHGAYGTPLVGCVICAWKREREHFSDERDKFIDSRHQLQQERERADRLEQEIATLREQLRQAQEREKSTIERSNRARLRAVQAEKELDEYRVIALRVEEHAANQQRKREELQDSIDKLCASYNSVSDERDSLKAQMGKAMELLRNRDLMPPEEGCKFCPYYMDKCISHKDGCIYQKFLDDPTVQSAVAEWQAMREVVEKALDVIKRKADRMPNCRQSCEVECEDEEREACCWWFLYSNKGLLARLDAVRKGGE